MSSERRDFLVENLDLPEAAQYEAAKWEKFQLDHLDDNSTFRIENKSRQIAYSWLLAAEAVADGILNGRSTVFQSINLQEAQEKIRYAHNVINALPRWFRPKLLTNNKQELEFDNGARLISLPGNPQRGKAQMNVALDEFAHIQQDVAVYTAALPVATKGNGRIRIGSSPMGAGGRFWEIFAQELRPYPGYVRKFTPWWEVQAFCKNVREARKLALPMPTAGRVDLFGNERIQAIYANMPEDDFRQEYEGEFVDESVAWITWDEIRANHAAHSGTCELVTCRDSSIDRALEAIGGIADLIAANKIEMVLAAGVDVGRTRNATEIFFVGLTTLDSYPLRLAITLENCEYDTQLTVLQSAMMRLPVLSMLIDRNGLGNNLAESMEHLFPGKAIGVNFTNQTKALWATDGKMLFQQKRAPIPNDRELSYQVHSIKRRVTSSKNMVFDTERNEKHHADKFWALMLALAVATGRSEAGGALVVASSPFVNYRG